MRKTQIQDERVVTDLHRQNGRGTARRAAGHTVVRPQKMAMLDGNEESATAR